MKPTDNAPPENPAIAETKQFRKDLDAVLQNIKAAPRKGRERLLAAIMWLGMDLKDIGAPNPYPHSYDPTSPVIEPTADGLKL